VPTGEQPALRRGGAGTYSDGKLYTRVDHPLEVPILDELVACGAPDAIRYDARAHVGTDRLHRILPALRVRLEAAGVRFHWRTRVERLGRARVGERIPVVAQDVEGDRGRRIVYHTDSGVAWVRRL
jgi:uncharacterized FAD-dependent dehydrogenase